MLIPPGILIRVAFFNMKLTLRNCYYAHLSHIFFHMPEIRNFEIIFTFTSHKNITNEMG